MRRSKFSTHYLLSIIAEHDAGMPVAELCRKHQISPATFYKWKKEKVTDENDTQRRLKELEAENKRLKKMYANLSLDHDILQQGYSMLKKWQIQDAAKN